MPRQRSPQRERAFKIFRAHDGKIANREIARQLEIPEKTVGGWKAKDGWITQLNGVLQSTERSTPKRRSGAPKGNRNAAGNTGGRGGPKANDHAVAHGFFRRIFPDDAETHAILGEINVKSPLDILWENIVIQYTAIARAQRIMFVRDQRDETKVLKRMKESESTSEQEWEYQHAWDKHAAFLQAQSRAISTLEGLLVRYEAMLQHDVQAEEARLRVEKLRAEVAKLTGTGGDADETDDGFLDALSAEAEAVWDGEDDDGEE